MPTPSLDRVSVQKAVIELLENAIQAEPATGIAVDAQLEPGGESLWVRVSDDGCGMDAYTLDHALDPFFSAKQAGRQVGMGLPRAQQWIAGHGGSLELHSTEGEGTSATFTIPLQSPPEPADTDHSETNEAAVETH